MQKTLNLQTIANKLKEQRVILLARLERKQTLINEENILNPDKTDLARISQKNNKEALHANRTKQQLEDIDQALNRLETCTYGICSDCGENIQPAPLEIMPAASLCIKCQRIQDNK